MTIEHIWQQYQQALKRFLQSKIANSADVDDLLQLILIKVHNNLAELKQQTKIKAWLFSIARNTVVDFYRQQAKHRLLSQDEIDFDQWFIQNEHNDDIEQALAKCLLPFIQQLPIEQQKLLMDIDIHNIAQKTYAKQHNLAYSTLKSRVQRARQLLKQQILQCCELQLDHYGNFIDCELKPNCKPC